MIANTDRIAWSREVLRTLNTLDKDEQSFIRMSYFDGLTQTCIAEQTGAPLPVVARAIATGMQRLGSALAGNSGPRWTPLEPRTETDLGIGA